uniref:Uncharacterized protein n=1 Tax=viral metagenome TaxID=1070528 RepID=A0A6C0AEJ1_9ZZZZ
MTAKYIILKKNILTYFLNSLKILLILERILEILINTWNLKNIILNNLLKL